MPLARVTIEVETLDEAQAIVTEHLAAERNVTVYFDEP